MKKNLYLDQLSHYLLICTIVFSCLYSSFAETELIIPGGDWRDTDGKLIAATEGGIIKVGDIYYLWGMDRSANNYTFVGINLYSSSDLKNWTFVNQILKKTSHPDLDNDAVIERAKILHNKRSGQFVIWMHYEGHNAYSIAEVAYATCTTIGGDYVFQSHFRPMGIDSRDINVYQDADGKAYLICTTLGNQNVSLFELDSAYTSIVREVFRGSARNGMECEGHAIINTGGYYFWLMSWCTGWDFNDNHYFYARTLAGPWTAGGKIATSTTHTYESQVGFAVTVSGSEKTTFLYTGDRWSVRNFGMSRIVLLPIELNGTALSVKWHDQYDINTQTGVWTPGAKNFIDGVYTITAKHSGLVLGSNGSAVQQQQYTGSPDQLWRIQNIGASHFRITSMESGKVMDISGASREVGAKLLQYDWNDGYNQKWHIIDCGDGYHRFVNVNTLCKTLEILNSSTNAGTDAVLGDFSYSNNQLWRIATANQDIISGETYRIENRGSRKVLVTEEGGGYITQRASAYNVNQLWTFEDLFNGYFVLKTADGKALDNGGSVQNNSFISTGTEDKQYSQQWQLVHIENGCYKIINRISGKVLDNKDGLTEDGNPVIQYSDYASTNQNQQWRFIKADIVSTDDHFGQEEKLVRKNPGFSVAGHDLFDLHGRKVHSDRAGSTGTKQGYVSRGVYLFRQKQASKAEYRVILQ